MKGVLLAPPVSLDLPLFLRAKVCKDFESRAPPFELHFPVHDDSCGDNDQVRSPNAFVASKGGKHRNSLDGLSKTHLVCKYTIEFAVMKSDEPVETNDLILSELSLNKKRNFGVHLSFVKSVPCWLEDISHLSLFLCHLLLG
jgi:hypothetical protein